MDITRDRDADAPGFRLALELPQRQHELAWWLARGLPEPQIAQRMKISLNTAVYHRRQRYNRLGVMGKEELMRVLAESGRTPLQDQAVPR